MTKDEVTQVQKYLQTKFGQKNMVLKPRANDDDSAEVFMGDEFIAIVFAEDDEGERSFQFQMAILDIDLEEIEV